MPRSYFAVKNSKIANIAQKLGENFRVSPTGLCSGVASFANPLMKS
jgi:hypothetical protein